jgi:acetone carboxylase gamma subunit
MKIAVTDSLEIDLDREVWQCGRCGHNLGSARRSYKHGLLVRARDPAEVHRPILDPKRYAMTFAPKPEWVRILEYCCPNCATLIETEYLPPGHPPLEDMQFDLDSLRALAASRSSSEGGEKQP